MEINYKELHKLSFSDLVAVREWCLKSDTLERTYASLVISSCNMEIHRRLTAVWPLPKERQRQYRSRHEPTWKNCDDEMYEQIKHLARYEFRETEI